MKWLTIAGGLVVGCMTADAQSFGASFSYFLPRNGSFSIPVSPFSIRDVGLNFSDHLSVRTGLSVYRMGGLNIEGLPFSSSKALTGNHFSILVPAEVAFQVALRQVKITWKGGVFGFYGFDHRLNYGNIDEALRHYENWQVANAQFTFKNHPGWGLLAGMDFMVPVKKRVGVTLQINYLWGNASFPLKGTYSGAGASGGLKTVQADYKNAQLDFTGLEISFGVTLLEK